MLDLIRGIWNAGPLNVIIWLCVVITLGVLSFSPVLLGFMAGLPEVALQIMSVACFALFLGAMSLLKSLLSFKM